MCRIEQESARTSRYASSLTRYGGGAFLAPLLALMLLGGCDSPQGPDTEWTPPAATVVDSLEVGGVLWACSAWSHGKPDADTVTVDLYLGRSGPDQPMDRPTTGQLEGLTSSGVTITRVFHAPLVRARVSPDSIPHLGVSTVRWVQDSSTYNVQLTLGFSTSRDSAVALVERYGGAVEHVFTSIDALAGIVPNDSLPGLRSTGAVRFTEVETVSCLFG